MLRLILVILGLASVAALQCRNAQGKAVDWFAMYKMPILSKQSHPILREGLGALYLDGENPRWQLSSYPINATQQALAKTLDPLYQPPSSDFMHLMYNDELPDGGRSEYHGHTKGVVAFDKKAGFWLIHSIPRFPAKPPTNKTIWPDDNFNIFGQSVLCISFAYSALKDIGNQLYFNYPYVYDRHIPGSFGEVADLFKKIGKKHPTSPPWTSVKYLTSLAGNQFISFAKYKRFYADLYAVLVAPYLKTPLLVETWRHGGGNLPSNCTGRYQVFNIREISFEDFGYDMSFSVMKDHSKWAVSQKDGSWTCIGDINRQKAQMKRAGGTMCMQQPSVWKSYESITAAFDKCAPGGETAM